MKKYVSSMGTIVMHFCRIASLSTRSPRSDYTLPDLKSIPKKALKGSSVSHNTRFVYAELLNCIDKLFTS
jgi:hypothetical protein